MRLLLLIAIIYACDGELTGPNICTTKKTYPTEVVVSVLKPYQVREYYWCISDNLRCSKLITKFKTEYQTQRLTKLRSVTECCNGFKLNLDNNRCIPNCSKGCGHGECIAPDTCECYPTYGGPTCNVSCPLGLYGEVCENDCVCKNNATCDALNGKCRCSEGWTGTYCQHPCMPGSYGNNCLKTCKCKHGDCHHVSGNCSCRSGWTGKFCDSLNKILTPIKKTCHCLNGGNCNINTETCTCTPGWFGNTCEKKCSFGYWGANCTENCLCFNDANCNHITGTCICPPGFTGNKCSKKCKHGTYGKNCMFDCNCNDQGKCSEINGTCFCFEGWSGFTCSKRLTTEFNDSLSCKCENENFICDSNQNCVCRDGFSCDGFAYKNNLLLYGGITLVILAVVAIGVITNCVLSIKSLKKTNIYLEKTVCNRQNATNNNNNAIDETSFIYRKRNVILNVYREKWLKKHVENVYEEVDDNPSCYNLLTYNDAVHPRSPHYQTVKKINNI